MKLVVVDSNIFIDLVYTDLIDHLFAIDCNIHTSLEVVEELNNRQQAILRSFQRKGYLTIHKLSESERREVNGIAAPKALSVTDTAIIFLARKLKASVLTGDNLLKKHCLTLKFDVHGILWLFERFHDRRLITTTDCIAQLEKLLAYNDRLPKTECDALFEKWKGLQT